MIKKHLKFKTIFINQKLIAYAMVSFLLYRNYSYSNTKNHASIHLYKNILDQSTKHFPIPNILPNFSSRLFGFKVLFP